MGRDWTASVNDVILVVNVFYVILLHHSPFCAGDKCDSPNVPDNAVLTSGSGSYNDGSYATFDCIPGSVHTSGDKSRNCDDGDWMGSSIQCTCKILNFLSLYSRSEARTMKPYFKR